MMRFFATIFVILAPSAMAQELNGDVAAGKEVAMRWCSSCHDVTGHQNILHPGIPSFPEISRIKGVSMDSLIGFQTLPHPPMPDLNLPSQMERDIAAYILSLKGSK